MNHKLIVHYMSNVLKLFTVFMLLPLAVSLIYRDFGGAKGFIVTMLIALGVGFPLGKIKYENKQRAKEDFILVALSWLCISVLGALPYFISRQIPHFIDCLFESISGFTTTGATILTDVGALSHSMLFWRSFTHWIGGMGVLVFLMIVVPGTLQMMKAESPGPAPGKLVPKMRQSSRILYILYFVLTIIEIILLVAGGMPLFDSVINAMSTAGTGGFSVANASIEAYGSLYSEVVITVFMILFGINFNVYFFLLMRNYSAGLKNEEMRVYLLVIAVSVALITWNLTGTVYPTVGSSLRYASFQVGSFITTTGFSSTSFGGWPMLSKSILFSLMFVGGCAGSTAGGIKVSRIILMWKECRRAVRQMISPRSVENVKLDGKTVDKSVVQGVCYYGILCAFIYFVSVILISFENYDMETTMTAVATCLNNVGAGFGLLAPGGAGLAGFSIFSKLVLSFNMLLGRLELYPILLLLSPRTWKKI